MLEDFICKQQLDLIKYYSNNGDEKIYFKSLIKSWEDSISNMPKTYEQDGKANDAIIYLHYFYGSNDWFISEKDIGSEQIQAFGLVSLDFNEPELGYISIKELLEHEIEFDLNWTPTKIKDLNIYKD